MYNAVFEFEKSQVTMIDCKNPREIFGETKDKLRFPPARLRKWMCDVLKRTCGKYASGSHNNTSGTKKALGEQPTMFLIRVPRGNARTGPFEKRVDSLFPFSMTSRINTFVSSSTFTERQLVIIKTTSKDAEKDIFWIWAEAEAAMFAFIPRALRDFFSRALRFKS